MNTISHNYSLYAKLIHLGLALFGIASYLTAEGAEGSYGGSGYQLHAYLGMTLLIFLLQRVILGYSGATSMRFSSWSPFSQSQWLMAADDVSSLTRFKIPERGMHEGIAGIVQSFGIIIFGWMAVTGTIMFFVNENSHGLLYEITEEAHEIGEGLIPLFLLLHIGAVVIHSLAGHSVWQNMWSFKK